MDDYSDIEDDNNTILARSKEIGTSDMHLAMQLELARQNSLIQDGKRVAPMQLEAPSEGTIYEGIFMSTLSFFALLTMVPISFIRRFTLFYASQ